jgi:polyisoprenoid-binding protein YceI
MRGVRVFVLAIVLAASVGAGRAHAQALPVYVLDPGHSFVHFEVLHFGTSTSRGRFGPAEGQVEFDPVERRGSVGVRIPTATIDTGLAVFDARLKRSDLLATEAHPYAFFVGSDFRFDGERLAAVGGEFTLRGTTQPLTLRALRFACRDDARLGARVCGGDFEAFVRRSTFGADFGVPLVADAVRLVIQVEGVRR